jgi:hypothetical protein
MTLMRLGVLRTAALIAVSAGAVGSLALMLRAGRRTPPFLVVIFVFWVLSPFVALAVADRVSKRWSLPTRATLYCAALVIAVGSLTIYGGLVPPPAGSPGAFIYVAVPPVSWLLGAAAVSIAALVSRFRS